jgi:PST family polysaccharide transporter
MALNNYGYWSLVGLTVASSLANCTLSWVTSGWRPSRPSRQAGIRKFLTFGGKLTGFTGINYFTRNADKIIIGYLLGSPPLGIYSKAYALLLMPISQINIPVGHVMIPTLSRLKNDPDRFRRYFMETLKGMAFITLPLVFFMFISAESMVLVLLGKNWIQAAPLFRWLAPAALVGTISIAPVWLCISLDRTDIPLRWALLSAPIVISGFLIGARWGIEGVAASFSLTWSLLFLVFICWAFKNSPVSLADLLQAVALPFLCSLPAAVGTYIVGLLLPVSGGLLLHLFFSLFLFGTLYLGFISLTASGRNLLRNFPNVLLGKYIFP